jgi:nucleotide-binding universal stress UspA family protein
LKWDRPSFTAGGSDPGRVTARNLAGEYLTAQAAPFRLHPIVSAAPPADVLVERIRYGRPRLLVMGAQGHHPFRDLFGTSVTRAVIRACPVPAFIGA